MKWDKAKCGCVKSELPRSGLVVIRCIKHRGALVTDQAARLCYFDDTGMVRAE